MPKLTRALLLSGVLSAALAACGSSEPGRSAAGPAAATGSTPRPAQTVSPVGDVTSLETGHTHPKPYAGRVPVQPGQLRAPLPDLPEAPLPLGTQAASKVVRIFYSDPLPLSSPYRDGGSFHATMLQNLLGQYDNVQVISKPVSQYTPGDAAKSLRTFYIGTVFDEPIPPAFLNEVKAGAPVTWMGYNLWELGDASALGLTYKSLHTALTPADIASTYSTITYKNYNYKKYPAAQEMVEVVADPAKTETLAVARDAAGDQLPYLLRSKQFYFVADNPFQYITTTDRYLVVADSLKKMLGDTPAASCKKQAILRLEDVSAIPGPQGLSDMLDVISELKVPFAMTVIPESYYDGVSYPWKGNAEMLMQVYRATAMGGLVIQHGDTHNYHGLRDPEGNSAEEWEFWDKENNKTLDKLTPAVADARIRRGRSILLGLGLQPRLWTTPHYEADVALYPTFNRIYSKALERRIYVKDGVRAGQFFPYPVRDVAGTVMLPENLGNVQPGYLSDAVLEAAEANKNLDCSYASLFVHPYLMQEDPSEIDSLDKAKFRALITGIQAKGFTFVSPLDITTRRLP